MKKAALDLAGRGLAVFPLTVRGKEPLNGSNGHLEATTDPERIERMWRDSALANIGIYAAASGLYVVDVDMCEWKGKQGGKTWAALVGEHGHVDTYTVRSWSGGLHFYYRMPEGMALRNTSGKGKDGRGLGLDIDTRGNGYVIAPPSKVSETSNGILHMGEYIVEKDLPIADLPQWIIDECKDRERVHVAGPVAASDDVSARVEELAGQLALAPDGQGNDTANRVAFWTGQYVGAGQIDEDDAIGILLDAISGWQWRNPGDFRAMSDTIIRSVRSGMDDPRPWERPVPVKKAAEALTVKDSDLDAPAGAQAPEDSPAVPEKEAERDLSDWATDLGQAQHLADRLRPKVIYADGVGWHRWDGTRWEPVSKDAILNSIARFYKRQFRLMLEKYADSVDKKFEVLAKAYRSFMGTNRMGSILKMLSVTDGVFVNASDLDPYHHLLNVANGVVDLRNGKLRPHDPDLMMTKVTRGKYIPEFEHPDWIKALAALPPEQADYMQIRMGQAASGHNAKDVVFMVGTGNNGKSAYSSEGVFPALGDYAHLAQPTLISKGQGTGATPDRALLRGCRFVLIEELPESHSLSVEELKRITDTAVISARMLHGNPFTFNATHTLFVTSNSKPSVAEVDWGTWRRLLLVDFPYTFTKKPEQPNDRPGDPLLKRKILEGKDGQHDAIVTWLVAGAMRYFANPDVVEVEQRPLEVVEAIKGWQMEADRIMAYFTDRLVADSESQVARADLFEDFVRFLKDQAHATWSQETFLARFRVHKMVRDARVNEGQVRTANNEISRPQAGFLKPLRDRERVFRGLRFAD